jgi:conjugal transfer pilus assembly protein TraB
METSRKIKIKQTILAASLMLTGFILVHLFSHWLKSDLQPDFKKQTQKIHLPNAANADLQSLWVQKLERKNKEQAEHLSSVKESLTKQHQEIAELKQELNQNLKNLTEKIESQQSPQQKEPERMSFDPFQTTDSPSSVAFPPNALSQSHHTNTPPTLFAPIVSHHFKLSAKKLKLKKDNYLPAGAFVEAVVLGGIDAASGVSAQSDPRPVLLRLTNLSVLPNRFRKDVRDCHVIAAGFGDISSERAYIRTERLSCVLQNGEVFEEKIEAYVAGEDGKDGLRGKVVRRESDLIFNSFLAGTIAGIGKGMSQSFGTTSTSPLGSTKTFSGQDILKSGLTGGAGEGAERLQKYFIERAEQMQPVIQISAGRTVTLIFLKGVELNAT